MDENQKVLVELLSLSIRGGKASADRFVSVEWASVMQIAQAHSVLPLVLTSLSPDTINKFGLTGLQETAYKQIAQQVQNVEILLYVFEEFKKEKIDLLAIKGLALKALYPVPETRTMCDFDLVVHEDEFDAAFSLLMKLGFRETGEGRSIHAEMTYGGNLILELHRKPFAGERFKLSKEYMDSIWDNAVFLDISGKTILTFSDDDTLLNLFLHLASHYEIGGFGLRQLCDIVLFVEAKQKNIDWDKFNQEIEKLHIARFVLSIITICHQLFNMVIPEFFTSKLIRDKRLDLIIHDIIEGGVYGQVTAARLVSGRIIKKTGMASNKGFGVFKAILSFLFPSRDKLFIHYSYIEKFPFLLPIAWIHRWAFNISRKERRDMIKVLIKKDSAEESFKIIDSRGELVDWILGGEDSSD